MQIHEKYNLTRFVAQIGFCQDKTGLECVVAVLKATFRFDEQGRITIPGRKEMCPVYVQDHFYGQPDNSSLQYPCDITHTKEGTDILINGRAYGRGQKKIRAGFRIGPLEKIIAVYGRRYWEKMLAMTAVADPEPFDAIAVTYENSYGGAFEHDQHGSCRYDLNPVGVGYCDRVVERQPLPFLEDPNQKVSRAKKRPLPAGLGAIPGGWRQRFQFAGTFDQNWFQERRPLWPLDFDERFYNAVPQDQVLKPKLQGGERLTLSNLHPKAERVQLIIPRHIFTAAFRIKDRIETIPMVVDTLLVEPDEARFSLSYRSAVAIGNDIRFLKSVHFDEA